MVTLYLTLSSLSTRKLSAKFYVKLQVVNKSSIKTNVDLNKKDKTNYKLQLCNVDINKREAIKMVQQFYFKKRKMKPKI